MIAVRHDWYSFYCKWRIPGVRKYALVFEMDLCQWLVGVTFGGINTVCLLVGPFEFTLLRRCDCCP
jgi:hypothetical protein